MKKYLVRKSRTHNYWTVYSWVVEPRKKLKPEEYEVSGTLADCYAFIELDKQELID